MQKQRNIMNQNINMSFHQKQNNQVRKQAFCNSSAQQPTRINFHYNSSSQPKVFPGPSQKINYFDIKDSSSQRPNVNTSTNHISIQEPQINRQKQRKSIFAATKTGKSKSPEKRFRSVKIFDSYTTKNPKENLSQTQRLNFSPQKSIPQVKISELDKSIINLQARMSTKIQEILRQKLSEKLIESEKKQKRQQGNSFTDLSNLNVTENNINVLKMELDRYRRCESLNKQNEFLYKKLVSRLKQQTQNLEINSSVHQSSKENNLCDTHKNSFLQDKIREDEQFMKGQEEIVMKIQTVPLLKQQKPIAGHLYQKSQQNPSHSKIVTFNNTSTFNDAPLQPQNHPKKLHLNNVHHKTFQPLIQKQYNVEHIPITKRLMELNLRIEDNYQKKRRSRNNNKKIDRRILAESLGRIGWDGVWKQF